MIEIASRARKATLASVPSFGDGQYSDIIARDKTSLDLFWLKNISLSNLDNPLDHEELAAEIIENIGAGLNCFRQIAASLGASGE